MLPFLLPLSITPQQCSTRSATHSAGCICAVKGFAISSIPVVGDTVMTTVPRHTTSPSFLVFVVIFVESSGSGLRVIPSDACGEDRGQVSGCGRISAMPVAADREKPSSFGRSRAVTYP